MLAAFPTAGHERLDVFAGSWDTTITMPDGATSEATDTYRWVSGGHFMLHEVDALVDGKRLQSVEMMVPDGEGGVSLRSYDANGSVNDFTARLDGNGWSIEGEQQRFAGQFAKDGQTLSGAWQQRGDDGNWAPLMSVELRKR